MKKSSSVYISIDDIKWRTGEGKISLSKLKRIIMFYI